jgi:hypothetical protein
MLPPNPTFLSAVVGNIYSQFGLTQLPDPSQRSPELREAVINKVCLLHLDLEVFGPYNSWQFLAYLPVFVDEYKPLGFQAATPSEQGLVKVLSRAM